MKDHRISRLWDRRTEDTVNLHQTYLIRKFRQFFATEIDNKRPFKTPDKPGKGIVRMKGDEEGLNDQEQLKCLRPDIAIAFRELSKVYDRVNQSR